MKHTGVWKSRSASPTLGEMLAAAREKEQIYN